MKNEKVIISTKVFLIFFIVLSFIVLLIPIITDMMLNIN